MRRHALPSLGLLPALACALVLGGCGGPTSKQEGAGEPPGPEWFREATAAETGIDFAHDAGPYRDYFMPSSVGSGVALFDFDGDGRLDLYLLHNGGPKGAKNRLYRQLPGGRFQDVSDGSGLDIAGHNMGVAVGDVNNDGRPDVLVTQYGGVRLFLNEGGGRFRDVTKEAGLDNPLWGTSACFFDYDRDGWLDLVVVNYLDHNPTRTCVAASGSRDFCGPQNQPGTVSRLFHNLGPAAAPLSPRGRGVGGEGAALVRFADVTIPAGLSRLAGPGLGVLCADFTGDGWPDILIANDGKPNHLWVNQKDGTFQEEAAAHGVACNALGQPEGNMGIAWGDVDGDGLMDLFITHLTWETNTLWVQGPRGSFRDRTVGSGLARPRWRGTGFGTVLADFDHDGALDLVLVNGRVVKGAAEINPELGPFWSEYGDRHQVFRNDGKGHFRDVSLDNPSLCGKARVGRGLAVGDLFGTGALDLVVAECGGRVRLFRNVAPDRGHWLIVRAYDPALRRDAYGAEVTVRAGGRNQVRLAQPGGSYLSSSDPRVHFGLGAAARFEGIEVRWPDGSREAFPGGTADGRVEVRKGSGERLPR
jgi:hypothetical protein